MDFIEHSDIAAKQAINLNRLYLPHEFQVRKNVGKNIGNNLIKLN